MLIAPQTRRWLSPLVVGAIVFHALLCSWTHTCCASLDSHDHECASLVDHDHDSDSSEATMNTSHHSSHEHDSLPCGFVAVKSAPSTASLAVVLECSSLPLVASPSCESELLHVATSPVALLLPARAEHLASCVLRI